MRDDYYGAIKSFKDQGWKSQLKLVQEEFAVYGEFGWTAKSIRPLTNRKSTKSGKWLNSAIKYTKRQIKLKTRSSRYQVVTPLSMLGLTGR